MKAGDRVVTVTGRRGVLQPPSINMPLHHLIKFDDGPLFWVLKDLVIKELTQTKRRKAA
jgi:hypothetical protein